MTELYSPNDISGLSARLKKRFIILAVALALIAAVIVVSMIVRIEWLSVVSVFLFGACAVFCVDLFCLPLHRYRKLLTSAVSGRTHTGVFEFAQAEPDISMVDGVPCRSLIFLGEPDKHGAREQRFYWDNELPLPAFRPGEQITLKYTGKNIIGWEAAAPA